MSRIEWGELVRRFCATVIVTSLVWAAAIIAAPGEASAAVVNRIVVQGNQRVDDETVKAYLLVRPGQNFSAGDVDESLKALFETGLFSDVSIRQSGGALVVDVKENPIINRVSFEGNKKFKDEVLAGAVQSKDRGVYTKARVQTDVRRILEVYRRNGRFQASVEPKVVSLPQNRVNLIYEIQEGPKTGVSSVSFIGNKAYSDRKLRDVIETRETGLLSFLRRGDTYDPDKLSADEERLRRFYFDKGYADFQVISSVADLDRERNSFFITFTVDEGAQYRISSAQVDSAIPDIDPASLDRLVRTRPGEVYSSSEVEETLEEMSLELAGRGYAFAQVRPRLDRDPAKRLIAVNYVVDEGPRAYIERINIRGNSRTRDYVIRREFDISEGDAFNRVLIDRAERRLRRLNYFETVRITTEPGSAPDRVIVNVDVQEKPTGEIAFSAGYTTGGNDKGFAGDISITERNFLGRGYIVRGAVGGSQTSRNVDFSFTDPYFIGRRVSATASAFYRESDASSSRSYDITTFGGGIGFGLPITEDLRFQLGYRIEQSEISFDSEAEIDPLSNCPIGVSLAVCQLIDGPEGGDSLKSIGYYALIYDTLDNRLDPKDGLYFRFSQEFAGLGGDVRFMRSLANAAAYTELVPDWSIVGLVKVQGGNIVGLGGEDVRIADSFFKGGETVRGFDASGFGPRDLVAGDALGAKSFVAGTAEVQFPVPILPEELGFRGAVFADVGTAFETDVDEDLDGDGIADLTIAEDAAVRSSVGGSILWNSPLGPLRADFAHVLSSADYDREQSFRLSAGTRF